MKRKKIICFVLTLFLYFAATTIKTERSAVAYVPVSAGGKTVGIKLYLDGLLCVGTSEISGACPARRCGIKKGDRITHINGALIEDAEMFSELIQQNGENEVVLTVISGNETAEKRLKPVYYADAGEYKTGMWVRDSIAGIGTVTFMLEDGSFAALGHGISDADAGEIVRMKSGDITGSEIESVVRGEAGAPGELRGSFTDSCSGEVFANEPSGIYGRLQKSNLGFETAEIADEGEVHTGEAYILANIDGTKTEKFSVEISRILRFGNSDGKCMVIRVTDENLINRTGGIVQGTSGSPIFQDGKLVGAVTHVFLDNPREGYGIFASRMMDTLQSLINCE